MAAGGYDGSINIDTKIDSSGFNSGVSGLNSGFGKLTDSLKKLAAAVGLAFGAAAVVNFGKASVTASTALSNAMLGLKSILEGQGRSFSSAQDFIQEYISDGLIPATNAITAYKNLASRGYTDTQIQTTLQALKDSAAFGRQANYSLGDAVQTATEGLKNENSVLVDNAGVTKNVAKMWADYATSIGVSTQDLTTQQKIQAEYNGIMEETRFQTGDAAKLAGTYSGEVQQLEFSFNNLKVAVGNAITPIAQSALSGINTIIGGLTRAANLAAQVSTALFGKAVSGNDAIASSATDAAAATSNLASATEAATEAADDSTASWDKLNVLKQNTDTTSTSSDSAAEPSASSSVAETTQEIGSGVTVSPAVQAAVDTFDQIIAPLQSINFDNLNAAFGDLVGAAKPLTKDLFSGLKWIYDNILVPLAKWTIEDAAPAFLEDLAGAGDLLSSTLDALKPLGVWLWNNFLQPLAQWTGGVIVDILTNLANALKALSDWTSQHGDTVRQMAVDIAAAFGTWKTLEFMADIQRLVGSDGLGSLGTALQIIAEDRFPKLTDVLGGAGKNFRTFTDHISDTVSESGKLITKLSSSAYSNFKLVIEGISGKMGGFKEAIGGAATAITKGLGSAFTFITSPTGLVILAIAALIAIVILLVTHWNQVKAAAGACWNWIVGVWNVAAGWFNRNVIQPIVGFFSGLWDSITGIFNNVGSWFSGVFSNAVSAICWAFSGIGSFFSGIWDSIQNIFGGIGGWFGDVFTQAWYAICDAFSAVGSFFQGIWDTIYDMFSWIGSTIGEGIGGAFAAVVNSIIDFAENTINGFIRAINNAIGFINYIPGVHIGYINELEIPRLATGAVIPPRAEFAAILGDQRSGTNIEAPADLIRSIVSDELSKKDFNPQVVVRASGNDAGLVRWMKFEIQKEDVRVGKKLAVGGGRT